MANLWATYKIGGSGFSIHFGLGAGLNYADDSFLDAANSIIIPAYTVMNVTLFYEDVDWWLGIAIKNIVNEKYWNRFAKPQTLRSMTANFCIKF